MLCAWAPPVQYGARNLDLQLKVDLGPWPWTVGPSPHGPVLNQSCGV